ncbi:hypothetical protein E4T56_gene5165, partial [Termitomyces sp. T112]
MVLALVGSTSSNPTDEDVYDYGLHLINDNLKNIGKILQDFPNMPELQQIWNVILGNRLLQEETDHDVEELKRRSRSHLVMDDEEAELRNPFPSPPSHYTNYSSRNLRLLALL